MPGFPNRPARRGLFLLAVLCVFAGSAGARQAPPVVPPETLPAPPAVSLTQPSEGKALSAGPILAGWDDGFYLRSQDQTFSLRLTGQLQVDYRGYENDNDHGDVDTFLMRR